VAAAAEDSIAAGSPPERRAIQAIGAIGGRCGRQHGELFIRLATRYERKVDILTGLIHLACALICLPQAQAVVKRPLFELFALG
jgi:hypothetical protein